MMMESKPWLSLPWLNQLTMTHLLALLQSLSLTLSRLSLIPLFRTLIPLAHRFRTLILLAHRFRTLILPAHLLEYLWSLVKTLLKISDLEKRGKTSPYNQRRHM